MDNEIKTMKWCEQEFPDYQVSSDGKVFLKGKQLKGYKLADGKNYIHLRVNKKRVDKQLDLIVAYTFLENFEKGLFLKHKDGLKSNCSVSNLEWITINDIKQLYLNLKIWEEWKFAKLDYPTKKQFIVKSNGIIIDSNEEIVSISSDLRGPIFCYYDTDGQLRRESVSRIVAKTYLPQIYGSNIVHHLDYNHYNNNIYNLLWCNFNTILKHSHL